MMLRATSVRRRPAGERQGQPTGARRAVMRHDERHLRRKAITLSDASRVLVDLSHTLVLDDGDALVLEDGSEVLVEAAAEELYEVSAADARRLAELAWHIGNRHLAAAIEADRILILRDHVIRAMLEGLGADVLEVTAPFAPTRGAYSEGGHGHGHTELHAHHEHDHHHHHLPAAEQG